MPKEGEESKMKRHWLFLLLALLFAASFSGCGSESTTPAQPTVFEHRWGIENGVFLPSSGPSRVDVDRITAFAHFDLGLSGVVSAVPEITSNLVVQNWRVSDFLPTFGQVIPFSNYQIARGQYRYFYADSQRRIGAFSLSPGFDNEVIFTQDNVVAMACSGACLYVIEDSGLLEIFDVRTGQPIRKLSQLQTYITNASHFVADGDKLYIVHYSSARSFVWLYEYDVSNPELPYNTEREIMLGNNDDQVMAVKTNQNQIVVSVWLPHMGPSSSLVVVNKADFSAKGINQVADYMIQQRDILLRGDLVFAVGSRRRGGDISATANKPGLFVYQIVNGQPTFKEAVDLGFQPTTMYLYRGDNRQLSVVGIPNDPPFVNYLMEVFILNP